MRECCAKSDVVLVYAQVMSSAGTDCIRERKQCTEKRSEPKNKTFSIICLYIKLD